MTKPTPAASAASARHYMPRPDSLPAQVLSFFARNPEESLTLDDISDKFDCTRGNIHTLLRSALDAGYLQRQQNEDTEWVYKAGPNAASAPQWFALAEPTSTPTTTNASKAGPKPAAPSGYASPRLMIDIAALVVEDNVPYTPPAKGSDSKWAPLFAKLTKKGQSVQVPAHAKAALAAAALTHNKKHPGATYRVAMVDAATARVWRTA